MLYPPRLARVIGGVIIKTLQICVASWDRRALHSGGRWRWTEPEFNFCVRVYTAAMVDALCMRMRRREVGSPLTVDDWVDRTTHG